MSKIKVLGPTDRYNYGDLLFPLIIKKFLSTHEIEIENYALVDSDLSKYDALPTKHISKFYDELKPNDHIIIAGGESLCATWGDLYSYLNKNFHQVSSSKLTRALDRRVPIFTKAAKLFCKGQTEYPFSFSSHELGLETVLSLNAVGGSAISSWSPSKKQRFARKLENHAVVGVRDMTTYRELANTKAIPNLALYPDTAILMNELLGEEMDNYARKENVTSGIGDEYIFFQVGAQKYEDLDVIYNELNHILNKTNYDLVLCPIGHAFGHEDFIPLGILYKILTTQHPGRILFRSNMTSVYEIMALIANSKCYIGTSLHGAITALSFGVPYVTFNTTIKKLSSFLETWGADGLKQHYETQEIFKGYNTAADHSTENIKDATKPTKQRAGELLASYLPACIERDQREAKHD